ncbi:MFS transporter [Rhodococcoides yunnanense]|uniref:MFS transporter n=1 Tax=Rhodococcoides yunnanense TaxID=278209 RepID=A0ABU4BK43_9NOCA|nr:MFS transporter [Rhodococcus yunnanensis]MDV6264582.1 MFS transporter [Rhodococcus yunnanensis]
MSTNASTPNPGVAYSTIDNPARRRAILIAVCVALMAVIASVTGLNVAQPQLAVEFDASQSEVLWFINLYTMSLAALLLPLGALGDRVGRKPMLLVGLAIFGLSNIAAGLAGSSEIMLASRFVSGVGAAMIMPVTLAVITSTFPADERAKGIGVWTAVAGGGGILGMYLSALLVDVASWRWLFALPVALVMISAALIMRSVPNSREITEHRFDAVGSVTSVLAVLAVVFALHEGPVNGWTEPVTVIAVITAVVAVIVFVVWELRQPAPLLDVRLFSGRNLSSGSLTLLVVFGVQAGIFVVLFPFLQVVLGWSALRATLALMPMALTMMAASVLAPRLAARAGSRSTMVTGIALAGVGLVLMASLVSVDGGYLAVLPGMLAMGLGMGLAMTPSTEALTSALPRERQGVASALNDVTREFGTALGVALLGAVLSAGYRNSIDPRLDGIPTDIADTAREGVTTAVVAADGAGELAQDLVRAAEESFVDGWQHSMWAGAAVMAALLVYVLVRGPVVASTPSSAPDTAQTRRTPAAESSEDYAR